MRDEDRRDEFKGGSALQLLWGEWMTLGDGANNNVNAGVVAGISRLIESCWGPDPEARPSFTALEARDGPFYNSHTHEHLSRVGNPSVVVYLSHIANV